MGTSLISVEEVRQERLQARLGPKVWLDYGINPGAKARYSRAGAEYGMDPMLNEFNPLEASLRVSPWKLTVGLPESSGGGRSFR
jgi:hypothetical protein